MKRIGIFLCHCGLSPLKAASAEVVLETICQNPAVVYADIYQDMCLHPEVARIEKVIKENRLERVVFTSCSPPLHREFLGQLATIAGLAPHQIEVASLREQVNGKITPESVIEVVESLINKLTPTQPELTTETPISRKALVIGGGIAGIQASLDIADAGYEVFLVEKDPSIGGHMIQYSEVFPTLDCPQCIMTPKMVEAGQHPNIKLITYSEVELVSGHIGNFTVRVRRKAAYVDWDKCNGCGLCQVKCATRVPSEFECSLPFGLRKAIYVPFAQAVPNKPVIDRENCRFFTKGKCQLCQLVCPTKAIDFQQQDTFVEIKVGAIIIATGFDLYPKVDIQEYESDADILHGIEFERILGPGGPTSGEVVRPSDRKTPKEVVFISCVGSRDPEHGVPYCSRVCCMYLAKMAMLYKHAVPDGQAYIFYMDTRSTGKGYEEFVQRAVEEDGVLYLRGRVSRVFREGAKLKVWGADTLSGKRIEISCDLVVLGMAMIPNPASNKLCQILGVATDEYGFITEVHPRLRPLETSIPGIYVAGTAQGPKDIPDSVAHASGAASKVLTLFSPGKPVPEKVAG